MTTDTDVTDHASSGESAMINENVKADILRVLSGGAKTAAELYCALRNYQAVDREIDIVLHEMCREGTVCRGGIREDLWKRASDQPQTDHELNIRLAELCEFPVVDYLDRSCKTVYPRIIISSANSLLLWTSDSDMEPWNPLKDERQAFGGVRMAVERLKLDWGVDHNQDSTEVTICNYHLHGPRMGSSDIDVVCDVPAGGNLCRPFCLAALEACEKLEERDA